LITGIHVIDDLIGGIPWNYAVEIYSSVEKIVNEVFHRAIAVNSARSSVYVLIAREYGGLNPYYLEKLTRIYNGDLGNIYVSRCFKTRDVIDSLNHLLEIEGDEGKVAILYTPYNYIAPEPPDLVEASHITSLIHRLKNRDWRIIVFNSVNGFGYYKPSGGNFHHHVVNVMIRVEKIDRRWGFVELVKHPFKPSVRRSFPLKILGGSGDWGGQRLLIEWF